MRTISQVKYDIISTWYKQYLTRYYLHSLLLAYFLALRFFVIFPARRSILLWEMELSRIVPLEFYQTKILIAVCPKI